MGVTGSLTTATHGAGPVSLVAFSVAVVLVTLFVYEFRSWYRLRHVPGPFLASISSTWMVKKALSGRFHEHLKDVSEQYGKDAAPLSPRSAGPQVPVAVPGVLPTRSLTGSHHRPAGPHWAE